MMNGFFDGFFFGKSDKRDPIINKKWAGVNIFYRLLSLVINRFVYTLPDSMDARFLEMCLVYCGQALVVNHEGEPRNLQPISGFTFSPYGYPNSVQGIDYMGRGYGSFIPDVPGNVMPDSVIIYDDDRNVSPISRIKWYANRLTEIQGSISACITNLRGSIIVSCTREQAKPVKRAFEEANDGKPVIINYGSDEGAMQLRPEILVNPITGETLIQLMEVYDKTLSEFCTEFGITANGIVNKLSGVSDEELRRNEAITELAMRTALEHRKKGLEKVNAMFGVECTVETNIPDMREVGGYGVRLIDEEEEGEENGE